MKWQSIETAPKDRTPILAWNGKFVSEALWEPDVDDNGHVGWCYSTFYNCECYGNYNSYDKDAQPIHWMHLPGAPSLVTEESTLSSGYTEQEFFNKLQDMFLYQELNITQFSQSITVESIFDGEVVDIHGNVMKISVLRDIVNKMLIF